MKNIFFLLIISGFFISCTRAVDTENSKVVIQLPELTGASFMSEQVNSKVSILSDEGGDGSNTQDEFSSTVPTGYTSTSANDVPINCYLVGIGGPEQFLNVNFAGVKNAAGVLQPNVQFGPYVGIRPAGSSIELIVSPGENRVVFVFGFNALDVNECRDIQSSTEKPTKSHFSKPYLIGKSEPIKFLAGQELTVPINLLPIANATKMDDFHFPSFGDKISLPPATMALIENNSFPQNTLRKKSGTACEPLDITLRASQTSGPGVLPFPVQASVISQDFSVPRLSSTPVIYENFAKCASNDPTESVTIPAGQFFKRVWTKISSTDVTSSDLSVAIVVPSGSSNMQSPTRFFTTRYEDEYKFEIVAPRAALKNVCTPIKVNYRKLYGEFPTSSAAISFDITTYVSGVAGSFPTQFFNTPAECNSGSSPQTTFGMTYGISSKVLYMRLSSDNDPFFNIQVVQSAGSSILPANTGVQINKEIATFPFVAELRFDFKNYLKPNICIPLNLQLIDQKRNLIITPNTVISSREIEIDSADSTMAEISVHKNDPSCTGGSQVNSSTSLFNGSVYYPFYLFVSGTANIGPRSISFKLDNGIRRKIYFDVTNSNH
jgi:hypothetical protein